MPIEASASGKNAYYLENCAVVGHRPAYAACLLRVEKRKSGRLSTCFADCSAAIGKRECPAMRMRQEEIDKGESIYFVDRDALNAANAARHEYEDGRVLALVSGEAKVSKRPSAAKRQVAADTGTYAAALNNALKAATPSVPPILPPAAPAVEFKKPELVVGANPGMSVLELARLRMAAKQSQLEKTNVNV